MLGLIILQTAIFVYYKYDVQQQGECQAEQQDELVEDNHDRGDYIVVDYFYKNQFISMSVLLVNLMIISIGLFVFSIHFMLSIENHTVFLTIYQVKGNDYIQYSILKAVF